MSTIASDTTLPTVTSRFHLLRAIATVVWAVLLTVAASAGDQTPSVPMFVAALLVIYPIIDVIASLAEIRMRPGSTAKLAPLLVNTVISIVTAGAIVIAVGNGADAVLRVFGIWALLTGLIQLAMAALRRRRAYPAQWPMILSGGISALAGITFVQMAAQDDPNLTVLAGYAIAGAAFLLVSAYRLRADQHSISSSASPHRPAAR